MKRKVEIYSAGCSICKGVVDMINEISCQSCTVSIHDMQDEAIAQKAKQLGIQSVPAVVIDGVLVEHGGRGYSPANLREAGVGRPLS
jgi:glutaredoxin 3